MNILLELQNRFRAAIAPLVTDAEEYVQMVRPSQDAKFGDYQANCAMPLGKRLGRPPVDVAREIVSRLQVDDLCEPPRTAGPGFINLRLRNDWLVAQLQAATSDDRLGIAPVEQPRTYVVDFSGPNVAKPMHVGHIRSTVIGDSINRTLRFLGHRVISDNHIGDWGTQFGMIIYGYKHFLDPEKYRANPVEELGRLYRLVNRLVDYFETRQELPRLAAQISREEQAVSQLAATPPSDKHAQKALRKAEVGLRELKNQHAALAAKQAETDSDPQLSHYLRTHPTIGEAVLAETARLHEGDPENVRLWKEFLPPCLAEIERIYRRLHVTFDHTLGESFYHDRLANVVHELLDRGIARVSEGATCVFLEPNDPPFIVRKQDGAFLYGTTDLATIQYRLEKWKPDAIVYVVDHRQGLHFEQLFATARRWGHDRVELTHVSFGTVLGEDGRPFKTRSGSTVGLDGLLDEAVERALAIVSTNDDEKPGGREMSDERRRQIAEAVGMGALKYADLAQNRTSDYVFSYDRMLSMNGNTATYMQYAYARVLSIFAKGNVEAARLRGAGHSLALEGAAERALGLALLQFSESLQLAAADYRPNHLTGYLFELANRYSTFFEQCPVLKAETDALRSSRLLLSDLTARTLRWGLSLLGIQVAEKM